MADPVPSLDELVEVGARTLAIESGDTDEYWSLYASDARAILTAVLPRVVGAAVEAEREECAKVAENHRLGENIIREMLDAKVREVKLWSVVSTRVAEAIRARTVSDQLRALGGG